MLLVVMTVCVLTACGEEDDPHKLIDIEFVVNYEYNGATITDAVFVDNGLVKEKNTITAWTKKLYPDNPTREGYVFDGWYQDKAFNDENKSYNVVPQWGQDYSATYYAKWTPIDTYTISFYDITDENPVLLFSFDKIDDRKDTDIKKADLKQLIEEKCSEPTDGTKWNYRFYFDKDLKIKLSYNHGLVDKFSAIKLDEFKEHRVNGDEDNKYNVSLYTKRFVPKNDLMIKYGTEFQFNVDIIGGTLDFNSVDNAYLNEYGMFNSDRQFLLTNAPKTSYGNIFEYWEVKGLDNSITLYNEKGNELAKDNEGKYIEKIGEDGKPISIRSKNDFDEALYVACKFSKSTFNITYYLNEVAESNKLAEYSGQFNSKIHTLSKDKYHIPAGEELEKFVYAKEYKDEFNSIENGTTVDFDNDKLWCDVDIILKTKKCETQIEFTVNSDDFQNTEHFGGSKLSYTYKLLSANDNQNHYYIKELDDKDKMFNDIMLGCYKEVFASWTEALPYTQEEFDKLIKEQYELLGFVNENGDYIIKVIKGELKYVAKNANGGYDEARYITLGEGQISLTVTPKFDVKKHKVNVQLGNGESIGNTAYEASYKNGLIIDKITKEHYAFDKWLVVGYDDIKNVNVTEGNNEGTDKVVVEFTSKLLILKDLTIRANMVEVKYTAKFFNEIGEKLLEGFEFTNTINTYIDKNSIDEFTKLRDTIVMKSKDSKYYRLVGFYSTKEITYIENDVEYRGFVPFEYFNKGLGYQITQDLEFKAKFELIPYSVKYMGFDFEKFTSLDEALANMTIDLGTVDDCFNKEGKIQGKKIREYTEFIDKYGAAFINGWYFIDKYGNKCILAKDTSISEDIIDITDGYTLTVYPILASYDVTLNAGSGYFYVPDNKGGYKTLSTYVVKGGYFGFDMWPSDIILDKRDINGNTGFYRQVDGKKWTKPAGREVEYIANNEVKGIITGAMTLTANWEVVPFDVTLIVVTKHPNGDIESEVEWSDKFIGSIEGVVGTEVITLEELYKIDAEKAKKYHLAIYTKDSKGNRTYITETLDKDDTSILKRQIIKGDVTWYAEKVYIPVPFTFDVNAPDAKFVGDDVNGHMQLETYVNEMGVDMYNNSEGGYYTKKQPGIKTDQGAPIRKGYVFAGWSIKKDGFNIAEDTIYSAYNSTNKTDIPRNIYEQIRSGKTAIWLGDYRLHGSNDLYNDATDELLQTTLYAQWIEVKTEIHYIKTDGTDANDYFKTDSFNFDKFILGKGEIIQNPYKYMVSADKDLYNGTVTWTMTSGGHFTIDEDRIASDYMEVNPDNVADNVENIFGDATTGYYYKSPLNVYEKINQQTLVEVIYENVGGANKVDYLDEFGLFTNYLKDAPDYLTLSNDKQFILRRTFKYNERYIDDILGVEGIAYGFASKVTGELRRLDFNGKTDIYNVKTITLNQTTEKVPYRIMANYVDNLQNKNPIKSIEYKLGDKFIYDRRNPIYGPKLDVDGNPIKDTNGNIINEIKGYDNIYSVRVVKQGNNFVPQVRGWKIGNTALDDFTNSENNLVVSDFVNPDDITADMLQAKKDKDGVYYSFSTYVELDWRAIDTNNFDVNIEVTYGSMVTVTTDGKDSQVFKPFDDIAVWTNNLQFTDAGMNQSFVFNPTIDSIKIEQGASLRRSWTINGTLIDKYDTAQKQYAGNVSLGKLVMTELGIKFDKVEVGAEGKNVITIKFNALESWVLAPEKDA